MRVALGLVLLVGSVLAGCTAPAPAQDALASHSAGGVSADWAVRALPTGEEHDHDDPLQHANLSTPNFHLLGWDPLATEAYGGQPAGGYFCGEDATNPEGRRLAVVGSFTSDVAFVLMDLTDPTQPAKVGEFLLPNVHVYDVAMTRDGRHVAVGTNPTTGLQLPSALLGPASGRTVQPMWRDACTGEARAAGPEVFVPYGGGVALVGIQDPAMPVLEHFAPAPILGSHSVSTSEVDGQQWVLASTTNLVHAASYFQLFQVVEHPGGAALTPLMAYQAPPTLDGRYPVTNGHVDGTIQVHPVDGKPYAYLADWNAGLVVLDLSVPQAPLQVAQWNEYPGPLGGGDSLGQVHGAYPLPELWDGRHHTILMQELGGRPVNRPSGWVIVLDTTDPSQPQEVGRWTLPVDVVWEGRLMFSTHYLTVVDRTMFVSMYHGGVWAVDLATLPEPLTVGVFIPANVPPMPAPEERTSWAPETLEVLAQPDGSLAVYDASTGVYTVRFDASDPAPPPPVWQV